MPARRKPKPAPEVWIIKCDGLRVGTAATEAQAKRDAAALQKTLPTYINFEFDVAKQT